MGFLGFRALGLWKPAKGSFTVSDKGLRDLSGFLLGFYVGSGSVGVARFLRISEGFASLVGV